MKPRIFKFRGIWYCRGGSIRAGIGYTPEQSYFDWLSKIVSCGV